MQDTNLIRTLFGIAVKSRMRSEAEAASQGKPTDLRRFCSHAAMDLFRALQGERIQARFVVGQNHCFCMVGDLIVDTAATQFRNIEAVQGVWIADASDDDMTRDPGVWKVGASFASDAEILSSEIWSNWPEDERPLGVDGTTQAPRR